MFDLAPTLSSTLGVVIEGGPLNDAPLPGEVLP